MVGCQQTFVGWWKAVTASKTHVSPHTMDFQRKDPSKATGRLYRAVKEQWVGHKTAKMSF